MQTTIADEVGGTLARLASDPIAGPATAIGLRHFATLFGRRGAPGIRMASEALRAAVPAARIEVICLAYARSALSAATA
ncbi:hypothetical protein [Baekduia sp. Peel2402]|uniref:hypothetical protein n=1 Tax=Baekduia sp. Peel2402 TaxID=3458296 RepID=UPI00403E92E3